MFLRTKISLERESSGKGEDQNWPSRRYIKKCGDPSKRSLLTRAAFYDNIYIYISPFIISYFLSVVNRDFSFYSWFETYRFQRLEFSKICLSSFGFLATFHEATFLFTVAHHSSLMEWKSGRPVPKFNMRFSCWRDRKGPANKSYLTRKEKCDIIYRGKFFAHERNRG